MFRFAFVLICVVALCGCPPARGGGGEGDGTPSGSSYAWLILTSIQDGEKNVQHTFSHWDRAGSLCSAMRDYYEAYIQTYEDYYADYADFDEQWGESADQTDPDYRRAYCELQELYYGAIYSSYSSIPTGTALTSFDLSRWDGSEEPTAGTYISEADELDGDDAREEVGTFWGSRTTYNQDPGEAITAAMDCDAYASDLDAALVDESVWDVFDYESWSVTDGSLEVSADGEDSWQLTLSGGVETNDQLEDQQPVELDASFERCEVEYEFNVSEQ